jgi:hypothetical protein
MENNKNSYIKTDNNVIINEKCIVWVKKWRDCLEVCAKQNGCNIINYDDTHKICRYGNETSYNKLNKFFE